MRLFSLILLAACTPEADVLDVPSAPVPTVPATPTITGDAPDFEILVQDGSTMRLWDHAGDVILIDMSGFT